MYRKINVKHAVRFCGSKTILIITLTLQHNFKVRIPKNVLVTLYPYKFETDFRGSADLGPQEVRNPRIRVVTMATKFDSLPTDDKY